MLNELSHKDYYCFLKVYSEGSATDIERYYRIWQCSIGDRESAYGWENCSSHNWTQHLFKKDHAFACANRVMQSGGQSIPLLAKIIMLYSSDLSGHMGMSSTLYLLNLSWKGITKSSTQRQMMWWFSTSSSWLKWLSLIKLWWLKLVLSIQGCTIFGICTTATLTQNYCIVSVKLPYTCRRHTFCPTLAVGTLQRSSEYKRSCFRLIATVSLSTRSLSPRTTNIPGVYLQVCTDSHVLDGGERLQAQIVKLGAFSPRCEASYIALGTNCL